ncbi:MAG: glycogen debranching enzyme N-terminal domain-containing protein [Bacteroidetes bacterium]|nr:glycogen debranching enzyme N-terminal domain-containing protein [Bacteroidota bacterium]
MIQKSRAVLQNFADATQYEWLETNGLGGWSGSTIIGAHTRRYHGLLTAATIPPATRMVLLSKLDETIVTDTERHELGVNLYPGNTIHPAGHHYLKSFQKNIFPEWIYEADDIQLRKTIGMIHGENTVVVWYEVLEADRPFRLELMPLMAGRGYHNLQQAGPQMHWDAEFSNGIFHNKPDGIQDVYISMPWAEYRHSPRWFHQFQYPAEQYRGLEYSEDLFNHGVFTITLQKGETAGIIISTTDPKAKNASILLQEEKRRRERLLTDQPADDMVRQLVLAADQFIVRRNTDQQNNGDRATVIAGYHWFTDWGRDTMISLPGLTLSTGRFADAKKIIKAFAASVSEGMLPNRFQDNGEPPEYNNVDGTLWYFIAVYKYLLATGDKEFVLKEMLPVLLDIIEWHLKGTRYHIHADTDGLLYAGEKGQQLTWMDARIGNWVVTPRMGKPVEIQALWYNALMICVHFLQLNKQKKQAAEMERKAANVKAGFAELFWNETAKCLYDVIDEKNVPVDEIRPNQLLAISLPFSLLEGKKAAAVVKLITDTLYTPAGLRTLPVSDTHYVPQYGGDQWHRDAAYHEGTVWSWLLGPYVDAIMKVYGEKGKLKANKIIKNIRYHLEEACVGTVSEIFDGDAPHHPRGCVAQAWGVAEILRVMKDYALTATPAKRRKMEAV